MTLPNNVPAQANVIAKSSTCVSVICLNADQDLDMTRNTSTTRIMVTESMWTFGGAGGDLQHALTWREHKGAGKKSHDGLIATIDCPTRHGLTKYVHM